MKKSDTQPLSHKDLKILLVTGNARKVWQAQSVLDEFGIQVENQSVGIDEIQSFDPEQIAIAKAKSAYDALHRPLIACDYFYSIPALKGFPGGYMSDIDSWFESEDFLALMKGKEDRSILLTDTVVYIDEASEKVFTSIFKAKIIDKPRGAGKFSHERVTVYDGKNKTIAECIDDGEHSRDMSKSAFRKFGEWYQQNG